MGGLLPDCHVCAVVPRMEKDILVGEESDGENDAEASGSTDEHAVLERNAAEKEPPRKSVYSSHALVLARDSWFAVTQCAFTEFFCIRESAINCRQL